MDIPPSTQSNYPREGSGPGQSSGRPPGAYFDYIGDAFNLVKNNAGVFVVGTLIVGLIGFAIQFGTNMISSVALGGMMQQSQLSASMVVGLVASMLVGLVPGALIQMLLFGLTSAAVELLDTGSTSINTIFNVFKGGLNLFLTYLASTVAIWLGCLFCIIPGLYIAGALWLAPCFCHFEGLGAAEALKKSWALCKTNAFALFGVMLVCGLLNFVGTLACFIGLLWTIPITYVVLAMHYRDHRSASYTP